MSSSAAPEFTDRDRRNIAAAVKDRFHYTLLYDLATQMGSLYRTNPANIPPDRSEFLAELERAWRDAAIRLGEALAGDEPSMIERLLSEGAALAWLDWHRALLTRAIRSRGATTTHAAFLDRCCDRALRRYLSVLRSLASVRRLDLTVIQAVAQNIQMSLPASVAGRPG